MDHPKISVLRRVPHIRNIGQKRLINDSPFLVRRDPSSLSSKCCRSPQRNIQTKRTPRPYRAKTSKHARRNVASRRYDLPLPSPIYARPLRGLLGVSKTSSAAPLIASTQFHSSLPIPFGRCFSGSCPPPVLTVVCAVPFPFRPAANKKTQTAYSAQRPESYDVWSIGVILLELILGTPEVHVLRVCFSCVGRGGHACFEGCRYSNTIGYTAHKKFPRDDHPTVPGATASAAPLPLQRRNYLHHPSAAATLTTVAPHDHPCHNQRFHVCYERTSSSDTIMIGVSCARLSRKVAALAMQRGHD